MQGWSLIVNAISSRDGVVTMAVGVRGVWPALRRDHRCHMSPERSGAGAPSASGPASQLRSPHSDAHTASHKSHCTMLVTLLLVTGAMAALDTRDLEQERLLNLDIAQGVETAAQKEITYKSAGGPHPASFIRHSGTLKLPTTFALSLWNILNHCKVKKDEKIWELVQTPDCDENL